VAKAIAKSRTSQSYSVLAVCAHPDDESLGLGAGALSVALLMDGGTATVYGPRAWAAFEEFASPAASAAPRSAADQQA